ncbi:CocE/NonD family hydrolase [Bacillus haynesii]|uniref:CocE/NonD family hydrolase n=2 Tax=Bacillaceae TaxID=186817 RepID=UPI001592BD69|nr:CocE/NonD family hydrolase [Bacillus haynesii]NVB32629.1 CocE/NonD family hydrolase [Bacillus licheniformis]MCY7778479.1 CocE/NonD family hydrolase [Bacillus haynesii]MEC0669432.1 CocE/NonD family hydrolase [Bacillus haynesii]MEC1416820.1 CocE/NonD family hydrolase [Bacillus haynesii]MEC1466893.1 CocE/NonD family hydrolase [Bacillus haynesii]
MISFRWEVSAEDGVMLCADVYVPAETGAFPVILTRTPYDKSAFSETAKAWCELGVAFVAQDVRGRYQSGGRWMPYSAEAKDGAATLKALKRASWWNGHIGLMGESYGAFTAFSAAQSEIGRQMPSALITLVPAMGLKKTAFTSDRVFYLGDRLWWDASFGSSRENIEHLFSAVLNKHSSAIFTLPVIDIPTVFPMQLANWRRILKNEHNEETLNLESVHQPCLHIGGWYDPFVSHTIHNFKTLRKKEKRQALVIGPWSHEVNRIPAFEILHDQKHAVIPLGSLEHAWLESVWSDKLYPFPEILLYMTGADQWIAPEEWPPAGTADFTLYLRECRLSTDRPAGAENTSSSYIYDPLQPVPSQEYPSKRNEIEKREDVLAFTSAPFVRDIILSGAPVVKLWVSSTAPSTDFIVVITEVFPDGTSVYLTHGHIRTGGEKGGIRMKNVTISMEPRCHRIKKGRRIRLSISSSSFPKYARHLNRNGDQHLQSSPQIAEQTIWHSEHMLSHLKIPIENSLLERCSYEFTPGLPTAH